MYGLCLTYTHSCNIKLYIQAAVVSGFTHAFSPHISHVHHSCWLGLYIYNSNRASVTQRVTHDHSSALIGYYLEDVKNIPRELFL